MKESFYSWNEYSFKLNLKAQEFNIPREIILELLSYSKNLRDRKLPVIFDIQHLAFLTDFRLEYIERATKRTENFYRTFKISKKNGRFREITEPLPGLKAIQYWILENIIKTLPVNRYNNAYMSGKSIVSNAKFHTKQEKVLNLDIEKFFDHITTNKVEGLFRGIGYNHEVAKLLSCLCTLNGSLPQGSPTSPYLSSILTQDIDEKLFAYTRSWNLRYSRYADDITISGQFHDGTIINGAQSIIEEFGFFLNQEKTRVKKKHQRQMVTGIVVNKRLSPKKEDLRELRKTMYYIKKYGIDSHVIRVNANRSRYIEHLLGKG